MVENPCAGQGEGVIPDLSRLGGQGAPRALREAQRALDLAKSCIAAAPGAVDLERIRTEAQAVSDHLRAAQEVLR